MKSIYSLRRVERHPSATSFNFVQLLQGCEKDPARTDAFCAFGIGIEHFDLSTKQSACFELCRTQDNSAAPPILGLRFLPHKDLTVAFYTWQSEKVYLCKLDTTLDVGEVLPVFVLNDEPLRGSRSPGCIQCLDVSEEILCCGTEKGSVYVYAYDWRHELFNCVCFAENAHTKLQQQKTVADGVLHVVCLGRDGAILRLVTGGADGNLITWTGEYGEQDAGEVELKLQETYRMDVVPVTALIKVSVESSNQILLVSGSEEGLVTLWNLAGADLTLTKLASLSRCSNPIHSLAFAIQGQATHEGGHEDELRLVAGDDAGCLYFFKPQCPPETPGVVERQPWEIYAEVECPGTSPIAAVVVHPSQVLVGICEGGIASLEFPAENVQDLKLSGQLKTTETLDEVVDDEIVEQSVEEDPPQPRKPLEPLHFDNIPLPRKKAPVRTELEEPPPPPPPLSSPPRPPGLQRRAKEEAESAEELLDPSKEKCYNGYIDDDVPPLPLSKFHEPCLNSSNQIKLALERAKLERFDHSTARQAVRQSSKAKVISEAVKELDHKKEDELLFANLVSVRETPLKEKFSRQKRKVAKQLPTNWSHEPMLERMGVGEQRKKASEKAPAELEEDTLSSDSSQDGAKVSPGPEKEPWFKKERNKVPWAKQEFYLTNLDDGSVGFRNFHSLRD